MALDRLQDTYTRGKAVGRWHGHFYRWLQAWIVDTVGETERVVVDVAAAVADTGPASAAENHTEPSAAPSFALYSDAFWKWDCYGFSNDE